MERTWDGQPIADSPPTGAAIVVYRRLEDRIEVLLLHRAHDGPDFEGDWAWGPPSGCRYPGEAVDRCARRELTEEIGVALPVRATTAGSERWVVYLAAAPADLPVALSPEHDRCAWLPLDRAAALTKPASVRAQLLAAARAIGEPRSGP